MRWRRTPTEDGRKKDLAARITALDKELAEARANDDALAAAIVLNNLGTVHSDLEEWADALAKYQEAAATVPDTATAEERATPHGNAANAARRLDDWPTALAEALQVEVIAAAAQDGEQLAVAAAAVGLVRKAVGDEFESLLDAQIGALPTEQQSVVRRAELLNPTVVTKDLPGRNEPCWCGSGKKYKHCHLRQDAAAG
ncbi:MAG: SEC-C domain-containing protein [Fimbriimonadaceae bacterium]|nr:SEC-C domain-containing protein [Fimbriimonadaceae bacterium]